MKFLINTILLLTLIVLTLSVFGSEKSEIKLTVVEQKMTQGWL